MTTHRTRLRFAHTRIARACLLIPALSAILSTPRIALAQTVAPARIDENTTWSGNIRIAGEVTIDSATLRVEPGTTIRFEAQGPATPALRLGGTALGADTPRPQTRLILDGTPDHPVLIETPEGKPRGAILTSNLAAGSILARHTIFRRLGSGTDRNRSEPALMLILARPENDLWLENCRFEHGGPVHAELIGETATAHIDHCNFAQTEGNNALVLLGTADGTRVVTRNVADAGFRFECPQVLAADNVLIGNHAGITIPDTSSAGIRVTRNVVHCTTNQDVGRYALRCLARSPRVSATDNLLIGGTYVVETAPAVFTGNVVVGKADLEATLPIGTRKTERRSSRTHYLIGDAAPDALIADNLLLGPAYAALALSPTAVNPRIENNLFDGWQNTRQAILFNRLALGRVSQVPLAATLTGNVFTRYTATPIADRDRQPGTLRRAERNIFVETGEPLFDLAPDAPAPREPITLGAFSDLRLEAPVATRSAMSVDDQLRNRRLAPSAAREMWRDAYRPRPDSPLHTIRN